jgi:hypothetical protein
MLRHAIGGRGGTISTGASTVQRSPAVASLSRTMTRSSRIDPDIRQSVGIEAAGSGLPGRPTAAAPPRRLDGAIHNPDVSAWIDDHAR